MSKVLIVTDCEFPGSALASRLLAFISMFKDMGYEVTIISAKTSDENIQKDVFIKQDNYQYKIVSSKRSDRLKSYFGNENLINEIEKYLNKNKVDFVFSTSLNVLFTQLLALKKKYNFKLILEQCEWLDVSSFTFRKLDPRYICFNINHKYNHKKADGIVAISRLLEQYYKEQNCNCIRIPSIINMDHRPHSIKISNEKIQLVFTGNTSKSKELIKPILEALVSNKKYLERFALNIYGTSKEKLLKNINSNELINQLGDSLIINGFIPQDEITNVLLRADYQIFIRPQRRSSNAGFPTKLCESMSVGTPCITNITGDIGLVLKDEINGFVVDGIEKENIVLTFEKILATNKRTYFNIRKHAYESSKDFFDYKRYKTYMRQLIDRI